VSVARVSRCGSLRGLKCYHLSGPGGITRIGVVTIATINTNGYWSGGR
jgi:hypothetical protein